MTDDPHEQRDSAREDPTTLSTCWTLIRAAAAGGTRERQVFGVRYYAAIRAFFGARWRRSALIVELEDAVQEVFFECFRQDGVLERADEERAGGFRAFLYGVARNVARRFEQREGRAKEHPAGEDVDLDLFEGEEETAESAFDREWALALVIEARNLQVERARRQGEAAMQRVDLLRMRFQEGMTVQEIARRMGMTPSRAWRVHRHARDEFRAMLHEVVSYHNPGTPGEVDRECARLVALFEEETR
jgi:RNA polymerase sigma-70 factor (ECF subfamily)